VSCWLRIIELKTTSYKTCREHHEKLT